MSRPSNITSLADPDTMKWINMILYGWPGCGKTVFWSTYGPRLLYMDSDLGTESAAAAHSTSQKIPVTDYDTLQEVYEWLKHEAIPAGELDWVVWDSGTLFQDRALIDDVLATAAATNPKQDRYVASQREYLVNQNRMGEMMRLFVDLPINFGVSAHVTPEMGVDDNIIYMPAFQGKNMPSKMSGYANVVAYMATDDEGRRRIITAPKSSYFAKDRFHALRTNGKPFLDAPNVSKVTDLVSAKKAALAASTPKPRRQRRRAS